MNSAEDNFISEELIVNKSNYQTISNEVICMICNGLLNNPKQCEVCETPFCNFCIDTWKSKNNTCLLKCSGSLNLKPAGRILKNLLDKVLLKCNVCQSQVSLLDYPTHVKDCKEKNVKINCPFCNGCQLSKQQVIEKSLNIDLNLIPSVKTKIQSLENEVTTLMESIEKEIRISESVEEKNKALLTEIKDRDKKIKDLIKQLNEKVIIK